MRVLMIGMDTALVRKLDTVFPRVVKELQKYWDEITVVCPRIDSIHNLKLGSVFVHSYGLNYSTPKFCVNLHKSRKFDLIISQDPMKCGLPAFLISEKIKKPVIMEVHADYLDNPYWLNEKRTNWIWNFIGKRLLVKADGVRVVNVKLEKEVKNFGVRQNKILYIPSAYIDTNLFSPEGRPGLNKLLSVGRLVKQKGLQLLLKSFKHVTERINDAKLTLIGRGPEENRLIRLTKKLGIDDKVEILTSFLPWRKLVSYYQSSSVYVVTSYYEGGPRTAFEAMACGTPVVSTRVGLMPELLKDYYNGFLTSWSPVEIADKIVHILGNKDLKREMAKNARMTVLKHCEWTETIRRYAEGYIKFVEENG